MKKRPTSVAIVAWILIVIAGISLITSIAMVNNQMTQDLMSKSPIPVPVQYAMTYAGLLNTLVCGIAMLNGRNWARFLYVIWSAVGFLIGIITSPMKATMIPGFFVFLAIAFFLFRPKANEYFSPSGSSNDAQGV